MTSRRWAMLTAVVIAAGGLAVSTSSSAVEPAPQPSTAWRNGELQVDTEGVVSRSDLVLEDPSWRSYESMPLGNGVLGAAVWAEDGFSAQLNRSDTFPRLQSAGRLVIPGLFPMAGADDYRGRVDLYDAKLRQSGGGMSATAYVRADQDQFVVEVTGADPNRLQTVTLTLWPGRTPTVYAKGGTAALAETFTDQENGMTTGAIAAVTARGRDVRATVIDDLAVQLRFKPRGDGSFRVVVGVPAYHGGDVADASRHAVDGAGVGRIDREHLGWWHRYWESSAPMKIASTDGTGEYLESLRLQHLYVAAATQRSSVPSGQAGAIRILYPWEDQALSPDFWFHFNLRQQVYANFGADTEELNVPYLRLYEERLDEMIQWTRDHWPNTDGACVSELFRYDGTGGACDGTADPDWLNRIVSSGAEVAHNAWLQYRYTGDRSVLDKGYPLMREVVRFYLSLLQEGADGRLHLQHVNALETQWDATDPTPDVSGMKVLFPIVAELADRRGDDALAQRLREALPKLPSLPTDTRRGDQVLAWSATDPTVEPAKNTQNADLEPVYPWGLLGADSDLAQSTFEHRVFPLTREWGEDAIWAARLGRADEMKELLIQGTEDLQKFPNGFTGHGKNDDPVRIRNYYGTWSAVVAGALQDAMVQSYEGVVRVAAAWPEEWDVDGSVQVQGGHRVSTQIRDGIPNHVGIQAAADDTVRIANPWPGEETQVVDGRGDVVVEPTSSDAIELDVQRGRSYLVERTADPYTGYRFEPVKGTPATEVKQLGDKSLGVADSPAQLDSDLVRVVSPTKLHALVRATEGVDPYVDRGDVISDLPSDLEGTVLVRGAVGDAEVTEPADYLTVDLARPATAYVAFDSRGEGTWWPAWLEEQGWTRTDRIVQMHDYARPLAATDGRLRASGGGVTLARSNATWGDQVVETTMQQIQVGTGLMFRAPDSQNGYLWQIGGPLGGPGGLSHLRLQTMVDGRTTVLDSIPLDPAPQNEYELRIEAIGDRIRTYVDGELVDDRQLDLFDQGRVGFRMGGSDVGEFEDIRVTDPDGTVLFEDDFSAGLDAWEIPPERQDVPLVVFEKQLPADQVTLGPPSGLEDEGNAGYLTFLAEQ